MRALCLQLNEATSLFQLSRDPRSFFALDQAIDNLTFARSRPCLARLDCGIHPPGSFGSC